MSLLESSPSHSVQALDRKVYSGKPYGGGFNLKTIARSGLPRRGGIFVLHAPGFTDEDAFSREPLAEAIALIDDDLLVRSGLVEHIHGSINHAREQRSKHVHGARKLAEILFDPDLIIEIGHSFGGNNVNDEAVHSVSLKGERPKAPVVIIQDATPGVREPHHITSSFTFSLLRSSGEEALRHPIATAKLGAHEATRVIQPHQTAVRLAELISLNGICIAEGVQRLDQAGIPVISVDYRDDQVVRYRPGNVAMDGGHLHSYFEPQDMAVFVRDTVIPMTTSGH